MNVSFEREPLPQPRTVRRWLYCAMAALALGSCAAALFGPDIRRGGGTFIELSALITGTAATLGLKYLHGARHVIDDATPEWALSAWRAAYRATTGVILSTIALTGITIVATRELRSSTDLSATFGAILGVGACLSLCVGLRGDLATVSTWIAKSAEKRWAPLTSTAGLPWIPGDADVLVFASVWVPSLCVALGSR